MDFLGWGGRYLDGFSLLLVVGGSAGAAALRSTREDLARGLKALGPLVKARPADDALAAARALRAIEAAADSKGIAAADRVETKLTFVRRAAVKLADCPSADDFALWAEDDLAARAARHESATAVWRDAADAAPAMGMIGTVIGLIGMFATMDEAASIGGFMAVAMLTTLYGLVVGSLIAGPIAARLERLSAAELRWQRMALQRLERLARAEPTIAARWLKRRASFEA